MKVVSVALPSFRFCNHIYFLTEQNGISIDCNIVILFVKASALIGIKSKLLHIFRILSNL